jgi:tetratricopeptide (TPR) repeat protein
MGHLQMRLGDRKQAEKFYSAAADLDSDSYLAQFYSAQSKLQRGNYEDLSAAETQLRKAIAINPRFAPSYRQLSYALTRQSKFPEALDMAEKAALLEPGVLSHSLNVANLMMAMGKIDEAYARAQQILARARTEGDRRQAELLMNQIQSTRNSRSVDRVTETASQRPLLTNRQQQEEDQKAEAQLRIRDEMGKKRKAEAELHTSLKTGAPATLVGLIKAVKCDYPATMDLVLDI